MIDITDYAKLSGALTQLHADDQPLFGIMTPQHMTEHLASIVRFSNGKDPRQLVFPADRAQKNKEIIIYTDTALPLGFKSPALPKEGLADLTHSDLASAIETLQQELADFDSYFAQYPDATPMNPIMGELNHREWIVFHSKHFTHHFKQFGLIR